MNPELKIVLNRACLTEKFDEALCFASQVHRRQKRKGTDIPYVSHIMAVAAIVMEYSGTEDEAIAALLHDAIEDGEDAARVRKEIRDRFGEWVLCVVEECTDADVHPKPPWRERKEAYIAHVAHASASAHLVAAADKLHNARSILRDRDLVGEEVWKRFKGGRDGMIWYLKTLASEYRKAGKAPAHLVGELEKAVVEMEGKGKGRETRSARLGAEKEER
ncbi:MAG TPA: HD domain-containing protein [bacterium]|nr:HD domain-containing protein [bacterium]